MKHKAPSL
ncbi:putative membrane protein, partial [Vibrio parahaemolyticus V-223/04]